MKVKLKKKLELNDGMVMLASKFYEAEKRDGYYVIKFADRHDVLLDNKFIKECKE